MTPAESMEQRENRNADEEICRNCGHFYSFHYVEGAGLITCDADNGIWTDNNQDWKMCGCIKFEPMDLEDVQAAENCEEL